MARRLGERRRPGEDFKDLKIDAIIRRLARPIVVKTVQDGKFRKKKTHRIKFCDELLNVMNGWAQGELIREKIGTHLNPEHKLSSPFKCDVTDIEFSQVTELKRQMNSGFVTHAFLKT